MSVAEKLQTVDEMVAAVDICCAYLSPEGIFLHRTGLKQLIEPMYWLNGPEGHWLGFECQRSMWWFKAAFGYPPICYQKKLNRPLEDVSFWNPFIGLFDLSNPEGINALEAFAKKCDVPFKLVYI